MNLQIEGFDKLNKQLEELTGPTARRVVMAGLREGAKGFKKTAKDRAPQRKTELGRVIPLGPSSTRTRSRGFLRRTIIYRTVRGQLAIEVGPRRAAFYGKFFEPGSGGHRAMPKTSWFSKAWRSSGRSLLPVIGPAMWKQLRKEVSKRGR